MAVAVQDLVLITDLESWIGISTGTYNVKLQIIISAVSLMIERYCRTQLKKRATADTEYQNGNGTNTLYPYNTPIVSVTTIHDDPDRDYATASLISSSDYVIWDRKIVLTSGIFTTGGGSSTKNIKLVYFSGYTTIPADLEMGCLMLCKLYWDLSHDGKNIQGIRSESDEVGHTVYSMPTGGAELLANPNNWPLEIKTFINPYKKKVVF